MIFFKNKNIYNMKYIIRIMKYLDLRGDKAVWENSGEKQIIVISV